MNDDHKARHPTVRDVIRGVFGPVKIRMIDFEGDAEFVWAYPLGGDRYRVENIPILPCGVSLGDVVEARVHAIDLVPQVERVVVKSGSITMWMGLDPPLDRSARSRGILRRLSRLGGLCEVANQGLILISVPTEIDPVRIRAFLSSTGQKWGETDGPMDPFSEDEGDE